MSIVYTIPSTSLLQAPKEYQSWNVHSKHYTYCPTYLVNLWIIGIIILNMVHMQEQEQTSVDLLDY